MVDLVGARYGGNGGSEIREDSSHADIEGLARHLLEAECVPDRFLPTVNGGPEELFELCLPDRLLCPCSLSLPGAAGPRR